MKYSDDFRQLVVRKCYCLDFHEVWRVAEKYDVPSSTLYRWIEEFRQEYVVGKAKSRPHPSKFTTEDRVVLLSAIDENPIHYIEELQKIILQRTGRKYSLTAIRREIASSNISYKKLELRAMEQCEDIRKIFLANVQTHFSAEQLVFVDETLCKPEDFRRKYGYGFCGLPAFYELAHMLHGEGRSLSSIVALSTQGILAYESHEDIIDANIFLHTLEDVIFPKMNSYPLPNSVLILDHASTHDPDLVLSMCSKRNIICLFLPPYSYDLTPIELCFHQVKGYLKKEYGMEKMTHEKLSDGFNQVTEEQARNYYMHCGY
jgi:transposase